MDICAEPVHDTAAEDIRYFIRHLDLWREGCPFAGKHPLFMSKRNRFRRDHELRLLEIAERYGLPAWDVEESDVARLLDTFDEHVDYAAGETPMASDAITPRTLDEAIDAYGLLNKLEGRRVPDITPELISQLRSMDKTLVMTAGDRFAYFRLELALVELVPGAQFNIGTVLSLLGPVSDWGKVHRDRIPEADRPERDAQTATGKELPRLSRLRTEIDRALPRETAEQILRTQTRWLEARRAWENEMQWAGHMAFKWAPPKGRPKGHDDNDPVSDWGKRMLGLQLELARLTLEPAHALAPLVDAACAYLSALHRRTVTSGHFLEPVTFRLDEASPAERKRRTKQRAAAQARHARKRAELEELFHPQPVYTDEEDDYHYGPPHEWEIHPNWNGTGNLAFYQKYDIVPPWERSSYPTL